MPDAFIMLYITSIIFIDLTSESSYLLTAFIQFSLQPLCVYVSLVA